MVSCDALPFGDKKNAKILAYIENNDILQHATVFYFLKPSQGPSLGCLASPGGPAYNSMWVISG